MEIERRFQKFCQKDQKLNFTKGSHLRDLSCPHSTLGHLSQTHDTCPLPFMTI